MVQSSMRNRADLGDNINNFTYLVNGPRGKLRVELASCAKTLSGLGPNQQGKKLLKDLNNNEKVTETQPEHTSPSSSGGFFSWFFSSSEQPEQIDKAIDVKTSASSPQSHESLNSKISNRLQKDKNGKYPIPENISEFNYNSYYIPDPELVGSEENIFEMRENSKPLPSTSKFWNIEYLFAEVDDSVRIMIAPVPDTEKTEDPIMYRETFADLAQEYIDRRESRRDFRKPQTPEEEDELRKFRVRKMYRDVALTRFYMFGGVFMVGTSAYIMFRKNKRMPITNNIIHSKAKKMIKDSHELRKVLGNKILFPDQTIGAKIGDDADFKFQALGNQGNYAVADISATYDQKKLSWVTHHFDVKVFNSAGVEIRNHDNWGIVKE